MKAMIDPKNISDSAITILLIDDDVDCRMLIRDAISQSKVSNRVFEVSERRGSAGFSASAWPVGAEHRSRD